MMTRYFSILVACLSFTSCLSSQTSTCSSTVLEPALAAVGPKTIAVNQMATYTLTYAPQTACAAVDGFQEQAGATTNSRFVGVLINYTGCNCPAASVVAQTTYTFKPTQPGTYYLNFVASTTTGYIADTLVVQ